MWFPYARSVERLRQAPGPDVKGDIRLALKMALAAWLSWMAARWLGAERPLFAALLPLIVMTNDPYAVISVSFDRVLGVVAGVALGVAVVALHASEVSAVGLGLLLGALLGLGLRVRSSAPNAEAAISFLFVIALARENSSVGLDRIWETVVGAGITIVVAALVWPPDPVRIVRLQLSRQRKALQAALGSIAEELEQANGDGSPLLEQVRAQSLEVMKDVMSIDSARRALRVSPLRRKHADSFERVQQRLRLAARLHRHTRSTARALRDTPLELLGGESALALARAARCMQAALGCVLRARDATTLLRDAQQALTHADSSQPTLVVLRGQLERLLADLADEVHVSPNTRRDMNAAAFAATKTFSHDVSR